MKRDAAKIRNPEKMVEDDIAYGRQKEKAVVISGKYKFLLKMYERVCEEKDAIIQIRDNYEPIKILPKKSGTSYEAVSVAVASDWHCEERVEPRKVNNRNRFNLDVAKLRVENFFRNQLKLIRKEQQDAEIKTHILALLGDFISGNIHEDTVESSSLLPVEAAIYAENLLIGGIEFLLNNSGVDLIIPCCVGNHSRITEKVHPANEQGNSLEFYIYSNIARHFKNEKRVRMEIAGGYHIYIDVYGYTLRFHHGHAINYNGGVGGITIPANKAITQWNDKEKYADYDVFGHFHNYKPDIPFTINGSLIGYSPFAIKIKAKYEEPSQAFFTILKGKGKANQNKIFL